MDEMIKYRLLKYKVNSEIVQEIAKICDVRYAYQEVSVRDVISGA